MLLYPSVIAKLIAEYAALMEIESWVTKRISTKTCYLYMNPLAMDVIDRNNINWYYLSKNPADWALDILEANVQEIRWYAFVRNTNLRAIILIKANLHILDKECWNQLSSNPAAIDILWEHFQNIHLFFLSQNPATENLFKEKNIPIDFRGLCRNPADWAVDILLSPGVIDALESKNDLSRNTNPRMIAYLIAHPNFICWPLLSSNSTATDFLERSYPSCCDKIHMNAKIFKPNVSFELVYLLS